MSAEKVRELGVIPIAKVLGFADAEKSPEEFTTAPSAAIPKALKHAGLDISDVDIFEINEAFAVVALANIQILGTLCRHHSVRKSALKLQLTYIPTPFRLSRS